MKIGLTYDLRETYREQGYGEEDVAELESPETVHAIEDTLASLGHETDNIGNIYSLARRLVEGHRWDVVFNIAEGWHGLARESQVPALLDA